LIWLLLLKAKETNSCLKYHQKQVQREHEKINFKVHTEKFFPARAKFYDDQHFTSTFFVNFKICFPFLVLLKMIPFEKILKTVSQKFAIQCEYPLHKVFVRLFLELLVYSFFTFTLFYISWRSVMNKQYCLY